MISVIVPVYNNAPYLQECLNSILNQTYTNLEVICVNDGSTDETLAILRSFAKQDSRVTVISQENAGVSAARNTGLEAIRGDYITFVDGDDKIEPDIYERLLLLATEHHADIAHCGYKKIFMNGSTRDVQGTGMLLAQTGDEAVTSLLNGQYFVGSPCNKLYKADLFSDIRFDPSLKINEDILVNVQVFLKAKRIVFWDVPKYHYFERASSSCGRTIPLKKQIDCVSAAEKILLLCKDTPLESISARRVQGALIGLYRIYVMENLESTKAERRNIHNRLVSIAPLCKSRSSRNELNYRFMRYLPRIYRLFYSVYNNIRIPNWEI